MKLCGIAKNGATAWKEHCIKKVFKALAIVALAAAIVFSMAACPDGGPDGGGGGGGGGGSGGGGNSGGWPPESILSQHGLSGMPAPPGATNIDWMHKPNDWLVIEFNATSATDAAVERWFDNNGWTLDSVGDYSKIYRKAPFLASYGLQHWTSSNGESEIMVSYLD